jgi:hypothetical protein
MPSSQVVVPKALLSNHQLGCFAKGAVVEKKSQFRVITMDLAKHAPSRVYQGVAVGEHVEVAAGLESVVAMAVIPPFTTGGHNHDQESVLNPWIMWYFMGWHHAVKTLDSIGEGVRRRSKPTSKCLSMHFLGRSRS